jgi:hypothetical protein
MAAGYRRGRAPQPVYDLYFCAGADGGRWFSCAGARARGKLRGTVLFVALTVAPDEQERRLADPSRAEFGKLRSLDLLLNLRADFARSMAEKPAPDLAIDTTSNSPFLAATQIAARISALR